MIEYRLRVGPVVTESRPDAAVVRIEPVARNAAAPALDSQAG
jgi:hypothetical protein